MSSNSELIRKADMAIADLSSGGLLNDEQAAAFIRKLIDQPTILNAARTVTMGSPQRQINKIGFGSRILRPAVSGSGLSQGDRSKPTTEQILLSTKEVMAEVWIPYDVIEDNIERGNINAAGPNSSAQPVLGGLKDTIVSLMAERAALDLEELAISGDTASGDTYLALIDGYMKQANTNVVNAGGAPVSRTVFKNGLKTMPDKYLRNLPAMRNYVSVDNAIEYKDSVAARQTAAGDAAASGAGEVYAHGVPVQGVALMPGTQGLLTLPSNLIFGIQRRISIETDKDISARVFKLVLTARVDFKIEEPEAVVRYDNLAA